MIWKKNIVLIIIYLIIIIVIAQHGDNKTSAQIVHQKNI